MSLTLLSLPCLVLYCHCHVSYFIVIAMSLTLLSLPCLLLYCHCHVSYFIVIAMSLTLLSLPCLLLYCHCHVSYFIVLAIFKSFSVCFFFLLIHFTFPSLLDLLSSVYSLNESNHISQKLCLKPSIEYRPLKFCNALPLCMLKLFA
jgi:hypothetical protein